MTNCREASNVKHISLFVGESRDLREKRDGSDGSSSRVAFVAQDLLVSLTIHTQRGQSQAGL